MSDLPSGWILASLEDLAVNPTADIVDGPFGSNLRASEYQEEGVPIIRLQNVKRNRFIDKNIKYVSDKKAKELQRHSFVAGDLVVTKLGDPLGEAAIVPRRFETGIIVADVVRVRLEAGLTDKKYVMYAINSPAVIKSLEFEIKGTTRPRVNLGHIRRLEIPVAPLNEQKRIAEKLGSLLAHVDSCQSHLERLPRILNRFRQSVLAAATSGRLTEDWREEHYQPKTVMPFEQLTKYEDRELDKLPDSWGWHGFADVASIDSNLVDPKDYQDYPHIAPNHIESKTGRLLPYGTIASDKVISGKHLFRPGQVIYSKIRPYLCKAVVVDFAGLCSADMYPISGKFVSEKFLHKWMISEQFTTFAASQQGRTVLPKINQVALNKIPVPIPPVEEQTEIVRRVESLFAYADGLEARYTSSAEQVERLTPALLAKAFLGELVDQDPNDEPASVLLERISKAREILPKLTVKNREIREYKMEEKLEEIIQDFPKDTFSFEDLREKFSGDYETLKEQLFKLLSDENPLIAQVFDQTVREMRFIRRRR